MARPITALSHVPTYGATKPSTTKVKTPARTIAAIVGTRPPVVLPAESAKLARLRRRRSHAVITASRHAPRPGAAVCLPLVPGVHHRSRPPVRPTIEYTDQPILSSQSA